MNKRTLACFVALAGMASAAFAHVGCSKSSSPSSPVDDMSSVAGDPIVIGVSNSLTGGLKGIGTPLQSSIRVAEHYVNSLGRVLGRKLKFVVEDDASDEGDLARAAMRSLLAQGAVAVIGPNGSGQVKAVQPITAGARVLEISATATSDELSTIHQTQNPFLFRTVPRDSAQGRAVVLLANAGRAGIGQDASASPVCKRMSILNLDNSYGNGMAATIRQNFGGTIAPDPPIKVIETVKSSYADEVRAILAAKPDCLAIILYDPIGDAFMHDLEAALTPTPLGWNPDFFVIGTDGLYTEDFIVNGRVDRADAASPTVAEDVYGTTPDTNPGTTHYNDFAHLYTAQFPLAQGDAIDAYSANEFDAAILIALAIEQAGTTTDPVKLRDSLYAVTSSKNMAYGPAELLTALQEIRKGNPIRYSGASGELEFNDSGDVSGGYIIWRVRNGKFETVTHLPAMESP